ncbi:MULTISPECIES: hypothetical protein [Archaeoglobus]|uniref:Uncharacterized protein AF_2354 n=1 Tax=Archaeoglobus fulgidus (strain ATCC 49558 / DSM 4304 / JCM 9628 / NBRC 100126 / VC-16) TaxID=224325 RepID=Y2354_ARCFU|nr:MULTISPECIES: hypothetical protein [Archaeoglobus]O30316.1 RecName: Full=Uncharacterized protein AF_2354; Flags: Precursor [Archaeoglobus fulgidus DSM 4304]AAB91310.1 predicted coding region AF_2354 [Archaeoglobus fulgidus DSM 4304]MDI3497828.1 hypothetical protein [Archaeoglobus sp.]
MKVLSISLIFFALLLTGCSQVEKIAPDNFNKIFEEGKQFVENTQTEIEDIDIEQLIEKAKELGFNTEILTALYDELKRIHSIRKLSNCSNSMLLP